MSPVFQPLDSGKVIPKYPVAKKHKIGDVLRMALFAKEYINIKEKDSSGKWVDSLKENGDPKKQLLLHGVIVEENTMQIKTADGLRKPECGERVRLYVAKMDLRHYMEGIGKSGEGVGDIVNWEITHGQEFLLGGKEKGGRITSQKKIDELRMNGSRPGIYGTFTLERCPDELTQALANEAKTEYDDANKNSGPSVSQEDEMPF